MWDALDDTLDEARGLDRASDAGAHCIVESRYVPSASPHARQRMQEQVYYLEKRNREDVEDETRALFTADETGVTRADARGLLWDNRSAKSVCFHRVIFSPSRGLRIATAEDAQTWIRAVMNGLGHRLDRELSWVGSVHENTGRLHVHVLVAGEAAQPSKDGARRVVRIAGSDLQALRERITIDTARPIADAARARELDTMRARQAARMADLDRRLGVVNLPAPLPPTTPAPAPRQGPAAPQAAPKRHWWQRGH